MMPEQVQRHRRRLNAQHKDERQDNRDRRRPTRQHPRDLFCSLTLGRDIGGGAARRRLDRASTIAISSDRTFHACAQREAHDAHVYT